jgi:N-(2-amino-2-carboxyethyl)-L-glutamate synthase
MGNQSNKHVLMGKINKIEAMLGNTELQKLDFPFGNLSTKLEYQNLYGSIKDRAACYILRKAIEQNQIGTGTRVIESTSGNFGISLSSICNELDIPFIPVIDPNISKEKEEILRLTCKDVIMVTERDETGGFLLTRIKVVKEYLEKNLDSYQPNQYENPNNYWAYYHTLGKEICESYSSLDYVFVSVSTGGTITGLSRKLKEHFKNVKIVGVDVEGSLIFDSNPQVRKITGIGAGFRSVLFEKALIDEVIILSQSEIIKGCYSLLKEHNLFLGASSGAAYVGACKTLQKLNRNNINALFISPDSGKSYQNSIYSKIWVDENIKMKILK